MITAEDLAARLGITGKAVRHHLRRMFPDRERGTRWQFTEAEADQVLGEIRSLRAGRSATPRPARPTARASAPGRLASDESYAIDLCDEVLGQRSSRQHRFDWLLGDPGKDGRGRRLPVDAFYQDLGLVVEYHERQHTSAVPHFDKPDQLTISGVSRGEQRKRYDERRATETPTHGLQLVVIDYTELSHRANGRLERRTAADRAAIGRLLAAALPEQRVPHQER